MNATVLIVDDEVDLVRLVRYNLEKEGFQVITAFDGNTALAQVTNHLPDLVILDLMLPDMSGFDICKQLKKLDETAKIPVLMLTARSSEYDRITGFESGAEDYVVKPFSPKELVLRVKAMLGRTQLLHRPAKPEKITLGPLLIYPNEFCVCLAHQETPLSLSHIEFKLLVALASNPNVVKTREHLIAEVWAQEGEDISDRTVDTHIKRLRQKLGSARDVIETIRGIGYRAVVPAPTGGAPPVEHDMVLPQLVSATV